MNLQGDIIGGLDVNDEQLVSYEYDSWVSLISIKKQYGNAINRWQRKRLVVNYSKI